MPASAVAATAASEVPWACCCVRPKNAVSTGTITMPPPTPKSPPASPAPKPARAATQMPERASPLTSGSERGAEPGVRSRPRSALVLLRRGRGRGGRRGRRHLLDQPHGIGEARGVRGCTEHDRDQVAALRAHPRGEAVARLADEAGLPAQHLVAPVEQAVRVANRVPAAGGVEVVRARGGDLG